MFHYCHTVDKPATDTMGRRIVVRFEGGAQVTVAWNYAWTGGLEDKHRAAVVEAVKILSEREYMVALATPSRRGFKFDLHELVPDAELVALLNAKPVA